MGVTLLQNRTQVGEDTNEKHTKLVVQKNINNNKPAKLKFDSLRLSFKYIYTPKAKLKASVNNRIIRLTLEINCMNA